MQLTAKQTYVTWNSSLAPVPNVIVLGGLRLGSVKLFTVESLVQKARRKLSVRENCNPRR